jgi:hypothetical protein
MSQRVMQYQAALQLASQAPAMYDMPELHKQMLGVLGLKNIEKIIPSTEDKKPMDPVSENMAILTGKPTKAFLYQDHEAHIRVHMAAMQDPKVMQLVGQSPNAQAIMGAGQAHIAEHVGFAYRAEIEKQMGVSLPAPDAPLPEEVEVRLSRMVAEAGERLLKKNVSEEQQKKNAAAQQDPVIQMQQQELKIKEGDLQRKAAKDQADAKEADAKQTIDMQIAAAKIHLERERMQSEARQQNATLQATLAKGAADADAKERMSGAQLGVKIAESKASIASKERIAGLQIGVDIAKSRAELELEAEIAERAAKQAKAAPE